MCSRTANRAHTSSPEIQAPVAALPESRTDVNLADVSPKKQSTIGHVEVPLAQPSVALVPEDSTPHLRTTPIMLD